jgi:hypothetical protein
MILVLHYYLLFLNVYAFFYILILLDLMYILLFYLLDMYFRDYLMINNFM